MKFKEMSGKEREAIIRSQKVAKLIRYIVENNKWLAQQKYQMTTQDN